MVWANMGLIDSLLSLVPVITQLVAISSGAAFNGSGGWGAYSISKSALNLLIRVYGNEHPKTHFSSLAPGVVDTAMVQKVLAMHAHRRYSAKGRIHRASEEGGILSPAEAADRIVARLPRLRERPSGSYADIRQM